jgi:hypothetical protein
MNQVLQIILSLGGGLMFLLLLCLIIRWILVYYTNSQPLHLPWVVREMDKKARAQNHCVINRSFEDTELPNMQIQLVNSSCESGLPHTSDANTIRLSESVWSSANRESTLKHERIHILQRRFPEAWNRFYREKWGYELFTEPPASFPVADLQRVRSNPDTAIKPWAVWQNRYWIAPLYKDVTAPTLLGVNIHIWDSQEMNWVSKMPEEWRTFFCGDGKCPHQWEHPHEIAAELWTSDAFYTPAGHFLKEFIITLNGISG